MTRLDVLDNCIARRYLIVKFYRVSCARTRVKTSVPKRSYIRVASFVALIMNNVPSTLLYFHCQNDCKCRADVGDGATLMVADSVAPNTNASLPEVCTNSPVVMANDVGWCSGGIDHFVGYYDSALDCWDACWSYTNDQTW